MTILNLRANLDQSTPARPVFSLVGLPTFTSTGLAPATTTHDYPDDAAAILDLSAAAQAFRLPSDDVSPESDTFTDDLDLTLFDAPTDDEPPYHPTPAESAYLLGLETAMDGETPAIPADRDDFDVRAFVRGQQVGRRARKARIAREREAAQVKADREAYDHGCECGYADHEALPIPPKGMPPRQAAKFLAGLDAGQEIRFREIYGGQSEGDEVSIYGPQILAAVAEDRDDRAEAHWSLGEL